MTFGFEIDHVQVAIPKGGEDAARLFFGKLLGLEELPKPADVAARLRRRTARYIWVLRLISALPKRRMSR
jgi:hypothetical protein